MTIEEAIQHCDDVAAGRTEQGECPECAADHKQLAEWLRKLVALRAQPSPAKLDRSRWKGCPDCKGEVFEKRLQYMRPVMKPLTPEQALMDKLTELTGIVYVKVKNEFCHTCGRPLTEEAWEELERRINDGTADT